jgi:hypothetical protein
MVKKSATRKAVENTQSGKVKKRLFQVAWKSRPHRGIPSFPTASAAAVYMTNCYGINGDTFIETKEWTFLKHCDIHIEYN